MSRRRTFVTVPFRPHPGLPPGAGIIDTPRQLLYDLRKNAVSAGRSAPPGDGGSRRSGKDGRYFQAEALGPEKRLTMKHRMMIPLSAAVLAALLSASAAAVPAAEESAVPALEEAAEAGTEEAVSAAEEAVSAAEEAAGAAENEYVVVGQYDGVKVARVKGLPTITDEAVDNNIALILKGFSERNEVSRAAEEGDAVTLDYTISAGGEEYPAGSASDYTTIIGDNTVFKGFDTSAVGHAAGDSWDVEHTYSDTYAVPELAGKTAVFHVTLKKVEEVRLPRLTDDFVRKVSAESETVDEYREEIRGVLENNNRDYLMKEIRDKVWQSVLASSSVKQYPEELIQEEKDSFYAYYQQGADFYEMSFDEFLEAMKISPEHFEEEAAAAAESNVLENLVAQLIAETEGLDLSAEILAAEKEALAENLGFDSVEELQGDAPNEAYVDRMAVRELVMDWVADHAEQVDPEELES